MNRGVINSSIPAAIGAWRSRTREPSEAGKRRLLSRRGEPLLVADWERALFLHFEVDPERLQPHVPFELDLLENRRAFVSLVAFTMRGMRPRLGGKAGALLFTPIATHPFLNVRTYVRHEDEPGIHFLTEWLPNRIACLLGPTVFGLPYQFGNTDYRHHHERGSLSGRVCGEKGDCLLKYEGTTPPHFAPSPCAKDSLDEFLTERYTAFTARRRQRGFFRVWHEPWSLCRPRITLHRLSVLDEAPGGSDWAAGAAFSAAHYSPGANDVWMGRHHPIPPCEFSPS